MGHQLRNAQYTQIVQRRRWVIVLFGLAIQVAIIALLITQALQPATNTNAGTFCLPPFKNMNGAPPFPPLPAKPDQQQCQSAMHLIDPDPLGTLIVGVLAFVFSLAGIAIFVRAQDRPTARLAYGLFYTVSLMCCLFPALGYSIPWVPLFFFSLITLISGFAATFVCLFPHPRSTTTRRSWLPYIPLWIGGALMIPSLVFFFAPKPLYPLIPFLTLLYNAICVLIVVWTLMRNLRNLRQNDQQLAAFVMLGVIFLLIITTVAGFASIGLVLNTPGPIRRSIFNLVPIPLLVLPIICDYALFRHQLLGTTSLLSRKFMRALMWILLASVFAIPAIILLRTFDTGTSAHPEWRDYLYACLLALSLWLFPLVWNKLRDVGDSVFYHDFYQYNRELQQLSTALTNLRGLDQISEFVLPQLSHLLNTTEVALFIRATSEDELRYQGEMSSMSTRSWHIYHHMSSQPALSDSELRAAADKALHLFQQRSHEPLISDHLLFLALYDREQISGFLCLGSKKNQEPYNQRDKSFLATLAAQIAVLEVTNRYLEQAQADAHKLMALNHRVIAAQEEERSHLALDLHDDVLQEAMLLVRQLSDASTMSDVADTMPIARSVVTNLRRTCLALRPTLLEELGLAEALLWLARQTEQISGQTLQVRVQQSHALDAQRLAGNVELAFYRVAQEALTNVIKHANAHNVHIHVRYAANGTLSLLIIDDGRGFQIGNPRLESIGIVGMFERMSAIGGQIHLRSTEGRGTIIRARYTPQSTTGLQPDHTDYASALFNDEHHIQQEELAR